MPPILQKVLDLVAITIVTFGFQLASDPHPAEIVAAILIATSHVVGSLLGGPPKSESRMLLVDEALREIDAGGPSFRCEPSACDSHLERAEHRDIRRSQLA
ncbi:hypothetical protein THAOC_25729 [Thalassiosira oceanica]|uniref:Holin n=1 Tax=Thalassiosira oceanica TaxID=159749 RepID=K0S0N7_THAOC|nr:hypothetical protein THAOC_25729 [Thalassiosira oceanica]|eukprot:EJK54626.1 hypothetical protein THAOC_25729 [Thalassiosira oceanica]